VFDIDTYLKHLDYAGPREPSATTLHALHKRHLITVPFDNSRNTAKGLRAWNEVDTDPEVFFDRLIGAGEGGVCHELSGIFRQLLTELGFEVTVLAAGVRGPGGDFGPDHEHLFLTVPVGADRWLIDVGFAGLSYLDPLRLTEEEQEQYGNSYRIGSDGGYLMVRRRGRVGDWQDVYRFQDVPRALAEFKALATQDELDPGWNWAGEVIATGTVVRARAFATGKELLVGRRYLRVDDGVEQVRVLVDSQEYERIVRHILRRDG
jgi:amide synthase